MKAEPKSDEVKEERRMFCELEEETNVISVSEGGDSSDRTFISDSATGNIFGKELHHSEERKTRKVVQHWAEIRPSLIAIEEIFSSRVKRKKMKGAEINRNNNHLPSIDESKPVDDGINGSK